jgi:small subunit ribosomal protein S33
MSGQPAARIAALRAVQSAVFHQTLNPSGARLGTKVLRKSLKGEYYKDYYYVRDLLPKYSSLNKAFGTHFVDPQEVRRLERLDGLKRRGKAPPKKKKEGKTERKYCGAV